MEGTLHAFYLRTISQGDALLSILLAKCVPWCGLLDNLALAASSAQVHQLGLEPACELTVAKDTGRSVVSPFCFPDIYLKACFLVIQRTESAIHGIGDSPKCLPSFS